MNVEDKGFINSVIKRYIDSKMALITKFFNQVDGIYDETCFLDDGYIIRKINTLKNEHKALGEEAQKIAAGDQAKLNNNIKKQAFIQSQIAFFASNNLEKIDDCLNLMRGINTPFKPCILALSEYKHQSHELAFQQLFYFFSRCDKLPEHYLVNYVYGKLLYEKGRYKDSLPHLRKAIEKRPEDIECHQILLSVYQKLNMLLESEVTKSVINL